jgi:hypothetical protein
MADTAETLDLDGTPRRLAPVTPIRPLEPEPWVAASHTDVADTTVADRAAAVYEDVKTRASESMAELSERARRMGARVRDFAANARQERPLQVLAAVAGAAFILGVAIRIWRSSRYE